MLNHINALNDKLQSSVSNIRYLSIIFAVTYLIVPKEFIEFYEKILGLLPNLSITLKDVIHVYQFFCGLTVITFIVSQLLIAKDTTVETTIISIACISTYGLLIYLNGPKLHTQGLDGFLKNSWQLFHTQNLFLWGAVFVVIFYNIGIIFILLAQVPLLIESRFGLREVS